MLNPAEWVSEPVSDAVVAEAQRIRAERDARYGNIFAEAESDLRWVGEVGEICFDRWLQRQGVEREWILDHAAGRPDFVIGATAVGVKTVKRGVPMRPDYTAQITAGHAREPVDQFFFACYEVPRRRLVLLGGIARDRFLAHARYYRAGEKVHASYTVRPGHEIYNIEVRHLTSPAGWLRSISGGSHL
jgi:hypothetical protein